MVNDFKDYAIKHRGIGSNTYDSWEANQNNSPVNSLTPYILEEREMRATSIDIFSRLMMDRILWIAGDVNDRMSTMVQAQILYLSEVSDADITMYIDSGGGSVKSGLSMVDSMNLAKCDINTINTGMAASMGSILLGAGTKGKRGSLNFSRVMLHQVSSGVEGPVSDMRISMKEAEKYNEILFGLLGQYTNKDPEQVIKDADRDLWLNSKEAVEYGIIDYVVGQK